jgi:hypothetical protein
MLVRIQHINLGKSFQLIPEKRIFGKRVSDFKLDLKDKVLYIDSNSIDLGLFALWQAQMQNVDQLSSNDKYRIAYEITKQLIPHAIVYEEVKL